MRVECNPVGTRILVVLGRSERHFQEVHVCLFDGFWTFHVLRTSLLWRKKIYNLLRPKLQLSTPKYLEKLCITAPNYAETTTIYDKAHTLEYVCIQVVITWCIKLQLQLFIDSCSFIHQVITTFYIFLQHSKTD